MNIHTLKIGRNPLFRHGYVGGWAGFHDIFPRPCEIDSTRTTDLSESFRITAITGTTGTRSPRRKIGSIDENDCENGAARLAHWRDCVLDVPGRRPDLLKRQWNCACCAGGCSGATVL